MEKCEKGCPDGALCRKLKKHINGRLWEIWNGINIDPAKAEQYRQLWTRQAGIVKEKTPMAAPKRGGCGCKK